MADDFKIVSPSVENISMLPMSKRIERGGRVCYNSEDAIKEGSDKAFVSMIIRNKHLSVLGHSQLVVMLGTEDAIEIEFLGPQHLRHLFTLVPYEDSVLVSAGVDAWIQFFEYKLSRMAHYFAVSFPEFFSKFLSSAPEEYEGVPNFTLPETVPMSVEQFAYATKETFVLICDRATAMQLRTYRFASHSVTSQRYCNFERKGFKFIAPPEIVDDPNAYAFWQSCKHVEIEEYSKWLALGYKPEVARNVLGQDTWSPMVITACLSEWLHIFHCRINNHTQLACKNVVVMVKDNLLEKYKDSPIYEYLLS